MTRVLRSSLAAHAAARAATDRAAIAAARAAGQAVATAHAADHSMGGLLYALKAMKAAGLDSEPELQKQLMKLPDHLRDQMLPESISELRNWESKQALKNERLHSKWPNQASDTEPGIG